MSAELEEQIAQLENSLGQEQQRLEKLWDAYEQQEKDLNASLDRINYLESDIETRQTMITSLQELLTERDAKLRDLEIQRQRQSKIAAEYEPKIKEMQGIIEDQTEKYEIQYDNGSFGLDTNKPIEPKSQQETIKKKDASNPTSETKKT